MSHHYLKLYSPELAAPNLGSPMLPTLLEMLPAPTLLAPPLLTVLALPLPRAAAEDLLDFVFLFLPLPLPFPFRALDLAGSTALTLASSCSWTCLAEATDLR